VFDQRMRMTTMMQRSRTKLRR